AGLCLRDCGRGGGQGAGAPVPGPRLRRKDHAHRRRPRRGDADADRRSPGGQRPGRAVSRSVRGCDFSYAARARGDGRPGERAGRRRAGDPRGDRRRPVEGALRPGSGRPRSGPGGGDRGWAQRSGKRHRRARRRHRRGHPGQGSPDRGSHSRKMTATLEGRELVVLRGGRRILNGASILVRPGEAVAIQGPSGSGKSTLARVLATLLEADAGSVRLDGRDAHEIAPNQFRTRVAFLAQQPAMFEGTVLENLGAGPQLRGKPFDGALARELIGAVGIDESMLSREARTLSGGEKQRVALARALANAPEVLLLDE